MLGISERLDGIKSDKLFIKHMYETFIEHYKENIGEPNANGVIITNKMLNTFDERYYELYGHSYLKKTNIKL